MTSVNCGAGGGVVVVGQAVEVEADEVEVGAPPYGGQGVGDVGFVDAELGRTTGHGEGGDGERIADFWD